MRLTVPDTKDCLTADSDDHVVVISIEYFDTKRSKKKIGVFTPQRAPGGANN